MARTARVTLAGYPVHLIQRGHNRAACFFSAADYSYYLHQLQTTAAKFDCAVHAYVLMTNHVHLLLTPACAEGPSLLMKHVGQTYVQYVNRVYQRSGTLWEGRFRSSIVQEQRYLLACYRYIELNPVRANIVGHPADYPWSSYRANAELRHTHLVTPHAEYVGLAQEDKCRALSYRSLFHGALARTELEEIRRAVNGGFVLGDEYFKTATAMRLGRRVDRARAGRPTKWAKLRKSGSVPDC